MISEKEKQKQKQRKRKFYFSKFCVNNSFTNHRSSIVMLLWDIENQLRHEDDL